MTERSADPGDSADDGSFWLRHGRRDRPPAWLQRWDTARRPMLMLGGALVAVVVLPAFLAADPTVLATALTLGWAGLLVMIASLWQPARLRLHAAWLEELRPPLDDAGGFPPQVTARCTCGWDGPARPDVDAAADDAAGHAPVVDPDVERPLG